ncbi:hypothetical protein J2W97_002245 [Paenibacillus jamilae]|nr:hypothetical protein [Paenibacillus jamilae]
MTIWEFMDRNILWVTIMFIILCMSSTYWGKR